jgi:hypothetical protein
MDRIHILVQLELFDLVPRLFREVRGRLITRVRIISRLFRPTIFDLSIKHNGVHESTHNLKCTNTYVTYLLG